MAPKRYTRERLDGTAADAAAKMKGFVPSGKLTCEYLHQDKDEAIKGSDTLNFLWKIESSGYRDTHETTARCNNVVERGVPFPDRWKTVSNCLTLSDTVRESVKDVTELGASNVKCELLGQAQKVMDDTIGKTIALNDHGSTKEKLLSIRGGFL